MCQRVIWKPDHSVPYVIHCLNDADHFLHGAVIIKPDLIHEEGDPDDLVVFRFLMNRGHMFFGKHIRHTETDLWFTRDEDDHNENYYIHPMTDDEFAAYNKRMRSENVPLSKESIVNLYNEECLYD